MNREKIDSILAQTDFVRSLARSLVLDEHDAEDISQRAFLAALESPRTPQKTIRPWLRGVVRNLTRWSRREETRRRRREQAVAKPDMDTSAAEEAELNEVQSTIAEAVLELEEPYRSAIELRYFAARKPHEVAKKLNVPVETVKTRLKRGLAKLRQKLDKEFGDRGAWCLALAPLAGLKVGVNAATTGVAASTVSTVSGGLIMATKVKVAVIVTIAIGMGIALWQIWPEGERIQSETIGGMATNDEIGATHEQPGFELNDGDSSKENERVPLLTSKLEEFPTDVTWVGRLIDVTGEPVLGAEITTELDKAFCDIEENRFPNRNAVCNEEGAFKITGLVKGRYKVRLRFPPQYDFLWGEVLFEDIGVVERDIVLNRAIVRGKVVDSVTKQPICGRDCRVHARYSGALYRQYSIPVSEEGEFELRGLPTGVYSLRAEGRDMRKTYFGDLNVRAGDVVDGIIIEIEPGCHINFKFVGFKREGPGKRDYSIRGRPQVRLSYRDDKPVNSQDVICGTHDKELGIWEGTICLAPGTWIADIFVKRCGFVYRKIKATIGDKTEVIIRPSDFERPHGLITVTGKLKYYDGKPILDAMIRFHQHVPYEMQGRGVTISGRTGAFGEFEISGFKSGLWNVSANLPKRMSLGEMFVEEEPLSSNYIERTIHSGKVLGQVELDKDVVEIVGRDKYRYPLHINLRDNIEDWWEGTTRKYDIKSGEFELGNVPPGEYVLWVQNASGHKWYKSLPITLDEGETYDFGTIYLEPASGVYLEFVDIEGDCVEEADIEFPELVGRPRLGGKTKPGKYLYPELPSGYLKIRIKPRKDGLAEKEVTVKNNASSLDKVRVVLEPEE